MGSGASLFAQFVEIIEALFAPSHQARMLDRGKNLAAVMRYALVGDVDADRIKLATVLTHGLEYVAHHGIHVRAESSFALDVGGWIILEKMRRGRLTVAA